ncbi:MULTISPECIES: FecR family protein [unclassified Sphingomonas]|uniref:FecR family protein n=1 Tax=unclassified Sphingomonas TaxID=196159 RepID=UPI0006FD1394|nr:MULTISPECIES: FecR domain-containing protein [unclassified Sphingomonas]KQM61907.1 hypothetical protein ASE65_06855 [Sphingomonas sp. Leaf16]KQN13180.1 hypothetical protein ASE81_07870 [Sphingomonas sp. Leaf29]KQN20065.1 hypothetical protein ASE83_07795 [Sphingomonas sp. Leaf32]
MSTAREIEQQAADWLMRSEEPGWSAADEAGLQAWLDRSMANKAAFWRLRHGWQQADRIVALGAGAPSVARRAWSGFGASPRWLTAFAASLVLVCTSVVYLSSSDGTTDRVDPQRIATKIGGHKIVSLKDGSRIELNTATSIRAAVTPARRQIWLDQGEAYFEVAHSREHPFVIHAGPRTVTVLGTKFSVRREGNRVTVSVVEGRVRIDGTPKQAAMTTSSTVTTGDVAIAQGASMLIGTRPPEAIEAGLAWREGMLALDRQTLGEAVEEFNRYNVLPIVIDDPRVAAIRIGGTFQASNANAFVRLLHDAYGLRVTRQADAIKISYE